MPQLDPQKIARFRNTALSQGMPPDEVDAFIRQKQSESYQTTQDQRSGLAKVGGFISDTAKHIVSPAIDTSRAVGEVGVQLGRRLTPEYKELASKMAAGNLTFEEAQRFEKLNELKFMDRDVAEELGGDVGKGAMYGLRKGLGTAALLAPAGASLKGAAAIGAATGVADELSRDNATASSVLGAGVVGGTFGLATKGASNVLGKVGRKGASTVTSTADNLPFEQVATIAPTADDDIARLIKRTTGREKLDPKMELAKDIYQNVLNVPKKGDAFEKLTPRDTVESMIKYKVGGNAEDILDKTNVVTGRDGLVSGVVSDLVGSAKVKKPSSEVFSKLDSNIQNITDKGLTGVSDDAVAKQLNRVKKTIAPNGQLDPSAMLDMERTLQAEAVQNRIRGNRLQNPTDLELADIKSSLSAVLRDTLDESVDATIDIGKYKTDEVLNYLKTNVSEEFANAYKNANSISELRSIQAPFVRMGQLMETTLEQPASASNSLVSKIRGLPVIEPAIDALERRVSTPLSTKAAIGVGNAGGGNKSGKMFFDKISKSNIDIPNVNIPQPVKDVGVNISRSQAIQRVDDVLGGPSGVVAQTEQQLPFDPAVSAEQTQPQQPGQDAVMKVRMLMALDPNNADLYRLIAESKGINITGGDGELSKQQGAIGAVDYLEQLYGRGDAYNVGTASDLSKGGSGSLTDRAIGGIKAKMPGKEGRELRQDYDRYQKQLNTVMPILSQALGSGTPQADEARRFIESAPGLNTPDYVAEAWFEDLRQFLKSMEGTPANVPTQNQMFFSR